MKMRNKSTQKMLRYFIPGVVFGLCVGYFFAVQPTHCERYPQTLATVGDYNVEHRLATLEALIKSPLRGNSGAPPALSTSVAAKTPLGVTMARKCGPKVKTTIEAIKPYFKGQSGEDVELFQYFAGLCGGTYLEMGALDGYTFSNTYAYNQVFGWKGLLIEGEPGNVAGAKSNRPNELAVVHAAVCREERTIHYMPRKDAVSGIWEFATPSFRAKWWPGWTAENGVAVSCKPLQQIIDESFGKDSQFYADFFSLDIEGAELEALESIDYDRTSFGVVLVESDENNMRKNMAARMVLESKGYVFLFDKHRSYWFINPRFHEIYNGLIY